MSPSEPVQQQIAHCPDHRTWMKATIRPDFYRCKKCKAIWFVPPARQLSNGPVETGRVDTACATSANYVHSFGVHSLGRNRPESAECLRQLSDAP
jgi:hypothetical protein